VSCQAGRPAPRVKCWCALPRLNAGTGACTLTTERGSIISRAFVGDSRICSRGSPDFGPRSSLSSSPSALPWASTRGSPCLAPVSSWGDPLPADRSSQLRCQLQSCRDGNDPVPGAVRHNSSHTVSPAPLSEPWSQTDGSAKRQPGHSCMNRRIVRTSATRRLLSSRCRTLTLRAGRLEAWLAPDARPSAGRTIRTHRTLRCCARWGR
jgi:hypothetical protein